MPENYLSFLPRFLFISFILNNSKELSSSPFPSQEREQLPCHKHQPQVLTLSCPLQTVLDALALLPCRLTNLAHKKRKVNPDLKCNDQGLFRKQAHTSLVQELPEGAKAPAPALSHALTVSKCGGCTAWGLWGSLPPTERMAVLAGLGCGAHMVGAAWRQEGEQQESSFGDLIPAKDIGK